MGLAELRADAKLNRERLLRLDIESMDSEQLAKVIKTELADNVWPWLHALVGAVDEEIVAELADQGEAIDELIDQSQNILHPELTGKIVGVFGTGKIIALALDQLLADHPDLLDELSRKRLGEMTRGYMQTAEIVTQEVVDATIELEPEPDEDDAQGEDDPQPPLTEVAPTSDVIDDALDDDDDDSAVADETDSSDDAEVESLLAELDTE